jgi:hypothetical protein
MEGVMGTRIIMGVAVAAAAVLASPATLQAQVPAILVCDDGTRRPGPSQLNCKDHGGVDWTTTNVWTKMRAGRYAPTDTVVCMDGQAAAAGKHACVGHGGMDSVSTIAAVKRRAQAGRYTSPEGVQPASRPAKGDSSMWGHSVDRDPAVRNPPGYRGLERPINVIPPDSADRADKRSAAATSRANQRLRQDSLDTSARQNPPGYRGMERPAGLGDASSDTSSQAL